MKTTKTILSQSCQRALFGGLGVALASSLPAFPAFAQGGQLEEVIVTANYREENLQDVAVAVSAISGDELNEAQIFGPTEIAFRVPGMAYAEFAPGQAILSMRGVSSADDGPSMDNSV